MKICIVLDDYLPGSTRVGAKMMHELGVEFVRRGHQVTVIAPQAERGAPSTELQLDGVSVRLFRSGPTKNVAKWRRALNESLLPLRAWWANRRFFARQRHDLIVYYSPCIFWGPLVAHLKRRWNAPSYLVLRDFFPQWAVDNGMLREGSPITRWFRWCEASSYRAADAIGIQSPRNLEAFRGSHPRPERCRLLYNWAEDRPGQARQPGFRERLGLQDKVLFFYGGAITNQQDIPNLLRLAARLRDRPQAHFLFVGDGYELERVRQIVRDERLDNVTLHPAIDQDAFRALLAEVDVGLFSLARCHSTDNFPGKVLGYLVQGLPVLGSVNPGNDLRRVIEAAQAGFVADNGEDDRLAERALELLLDPGLRARTGANARLLLQSMFSVQAAADAIEGAFGRAAT